MCPPKTVGQVNSWALVYAYACIVSTTYANASFAIMSAPGVRGPSIGVTEMPATQSSEKDQLVDRWSELESEHARVREALEHALQREHRLSLSEYEVLRRLSESAEGHRRIQELAEEINLS